jgi:hypothetical protein
MKAEQGWAAVDGYGQRKGAIEDRQSQELYAKEENRWRRGKSRYRVAHVEVREIKPC